MINKLLIYLSHYFHRIVIYLFFISILGIAAIAVITYRPIPKLFGYIFFFICGMYVGLGLYKEAMEFLRNENRKGNKYLQNLVNRKEKKLHISYKKDRIYKRIKEMIDAGTGEKYIELAQELLQEGKSTVVVAALIKHLFQNELEENNYAKIQDLYDKRQSEYPKARGEDDRGRKNDRYGRKRDYKDREERWFISKGSSEDAE